MGLIADVSAGASVALIPTAVDFVIAVVADKFYHGSKFFSSESLINGVKVAAPAFLGYAYEYGRDISQVEGTESTHKYLNKGIGVVIAGGLYAVIEIATHHKGESKGDGHKETAMRFGKDFVYAGAIFLVSDFATIPLKNVFSSIKGGTAATE